MEEKEIYVSNGKRALWQLILAALLYTVTLYFVYLFIIRFTASVYSNPKGLGGLIELAVFCFAGGIGFSRVVDYKFDLKNREYRIIYNFGLVNFGKTHQFNSIDYIAVYYNQTTEVFEINLWYNTNKHFALAIYEDAESALKVGAALAKKLELDLWNATDPANGEWV